MREKREVASSRLTATRCSAIIGVLRSFHLPTLLFSVFVLLRGHNEPGGGFIGGLIAVSGLAIYGIAFGTGAVKITPAHDHDDHATGRRHGLPLIDILEDDGRIAPTGGRFAEQSRSRRPEVES